MTDQEILKRKRRVSLTIEEIGILEAALSVFTVQPAKDLRERLQEVIRQENDPEHRRIIDAYRGAVTVKDGEIELDEDAEVSLGEDPGAYVMVWTWVDAADAGLEVEEPEFTCEECLQRDVTQSDVSAGLCVLCQAQLNGSMLK